jgi:hypothetical protein
MFLLALACDSHVRDVTRSAAGANLFTQRGRIGSNEMRTWWQAVIALTVSNGLVSSHSRGSGPNLTSLVRLVCVNFEHASRLCSRRIDIHFSFQFEFDCMGFITQVLTVYWSTTSLQPRVDSFQWSCILSLWFSERCCVLQSTVVKRHYVSQERCVSCRDVDAEVTLLSLERNRRLGHDSSASDLYGEGDT